MRCLSLESFYQLLYEVEERPSSWMKLTVSFVSRTSVTSVCKAMEVLKAIESTYDRHSLAIVSLSGHVYQKLASNIILTIEKAKVE